MENKEINKECLEFIAFLKNENKYSDEKAEELYNYIRFLHCL